jgi:hypothetical protein
MIIKIKKYKDKENHYIPFNMLKTITKTIKSLPKLKLKTGRRRNRDESIKCCRWHLFPSVIPTGNKLKCAPKFSKVPPFFFIRRKFTADNSVGNSDSDRRFGMCNFRRWLPSVSPSEIVAKARNFFQSLCEIPTELFRRWLSSVIASEMLSVMPSEIVAKARNFFPTLCVIRTELFRRWVLSVIARRLFRRKCRRKLWQMLVICFQLFVKYRRHYSVGDVRR